MCTSSTIIRIYKYRRIKIKSLYPCSFIPVQTVGKMSPQTMRWRFPFNRNHSFPRLEIMQQTLVVVLFFGLATSIYGLDLSHAAQPAQEIDPRLFNFINDFYAQVVYPPLNHVVTSLYNINPGDMSTTIELFPFIFQTWLSWALNYWPVFLKTVFLLLVVAPSIQPKPNFAVSGVDCGTTLWSHPLKTHSQVTHALER